MTQALKGLLSSSGSGSQAWLLWVAVGAVALSAVALVGGIVLHLVGYVLASLLAFTAIAIFRRRSLEMSTAAGVGLARSFKLLAAGTLFVGFVISIAHAWFIASHVS